jgi:hypothetical protein
LRIDIMLVQALLRLFYYELMGFNGGNDPPNDGQGVIKVDGILGPETLKHMRHAQQNFRRVGYEIANDTRFDPYRGVKVRTPVKFLRYSMELLNNGCHNFCLDNNVDYYNKLGSRAETPLELRQALTNVKSQASAYGRAYA